MLPHANSLLGSTDHVRLCGQGAEVAADGIWYRSWCEHDELEVAILDDANRVSRVVALEPEGGGYFSGVDRLGKAGDLYKYRFGSGDLWPDPASRFQPKGVHGPSMVVDPAYDWRDRSWRRPSPSELIIYEVHIGAFTAEGTFRSAIDRLTHVAALGVTAIELMPLADFPGERNWGYDGVKLYAPAHAYGTPDDLRALVDAAHGCGLAVILDVVYNHFGPDGNYTGVFHGSYTNPNHETPWGKALNYAVAPVREFFRDNAQYWMKEFHIDGFRLDATHSIVDSSTPHILAEIAQAVHAGGGFVVAEDERNEPSLLRAEEREGLGFDAVWADDFHHALRVRLTKEREGYYGNFSGTTQELAQAITHGWYYRGQAQPTTGERRGGETRGLNPSQFIYCISNHDQVGNRAFGERLAELTSAAAYRAASALLCLVPQTPMLFMGQEWAASTPFQFFTDHDGELGKAITEGRRREFAAFSAFRDPALRELIPDPQMKQTFLNSKLNWEETLEPDHAAMILLYSEFLRLRRTAPVFRNRAQDSYLVLQLENEIIAILFGQAAEFNLAVLTDLEGGHSMPDLHQGRLAPPAGRDWEVILSSNEPRFGGDGGPPFEVASTIVLEAR